MYTSFLDCIDFPEDELPDYYQEFTKGYTGFNPMKEHLNDMDPRKDYIGTETSRDYFDRDYIKGYEREDESQLQTQRAEILETSNKLLGPSKKISKRATTTKSKRKKKRKATTDKPIDRQNAKKLSNFFKKWRQLRKRNNDLKGQVRLWFSSYNLKLNKTYIYKDFFDSVRVHFRVVLRDNVAIPQKMKEEEWLNLFVKLTDYLKNEVEKSKDIIMQRKKCQVYPVWIESMDSFTLGDLSTHINEKVGLDGL